MGKSEDAVEKIEGYDSGWYDEGMSDDGDAEGSLDTLVDLNGADFEKTVEDLDPGVTLKLITASRQQGLADKEEYRGIVNALDTGDTKDVVQAKNDAAENAKKPKFKQHPGELPPEGDHPKGGLIELHMPDGSSARLRELIKDTQFVMQWGIDQLGARNPEAAPDFTNILDSQKLKSAEGWSDIRDSHEDLKGRLEDRQDNYDEKNDDVNVKTEDSKLTNHKTFKKLIEIKDGLNEKLTLDFMDTGARRDGNKITITPGSPRDQLPTETLYKKGDDGYFYLTAEAEQKYFVKELKNSRDAWEEEYQRAAKVFQDQATGIDDDPEDDNPGDNPGGNPGDNPGGNPGDNPGGNPGDNPGGNPGDNPGAAPGDTPTGTDDTQGDSSESGNPKEVDAALDAPPDYGSDSDEESGATDSSSEESGENAESGDSTQQTSAPSAAGGGDSGMGMMMPVMAGMMSSLPQTMQGMQQKQDTSESDKESEKDELEQQQEQQPVTGQQAEYPGQPTGAMAPVGDAPPVGNADGMVDAQLPDGTTQKVSAAVAEALNTEANNPNGSDARAAYAGSLGESTPAHSWTSVDASNLRTGDVVQWENRSALVVVAEDGLYTMSGGQMVPLDTSNPVDDDHGSYGMFQGFFHPTGLDAATDPAQAAPPAPSTATAQEPSTPPKLPEVPTPPPTDQV